MISGSLNGKNVSGKTIDHMGMPANKMQYYDAANEANFLQQITDHIGKADYILVDIRALNTQQQETVMKYINKNHSNNLDKIIIMQ